MGVVGDELLEPWFGGEAPGVFKDAAEGAGDFGPQKVMGPTRRARVLGW